jgi:hypothetical protein
MAAGDGAAGDQPEAPPPSSTERRRSSLLDKLGLGKNVDPTVHADKVRRRPSQQHFPSSGASPCDRAWRRLCPVQPIFSHSLSVCVCVCVCWQRVDLAKTREAIKSWPKMYKGYVDLAFWLTFVALYCVVLTQQQKVRGLLKTTL